MINPMRDSLNSIIRMESKLIKKPALIYFRDSQDHQHQVISNLDVFRESLVNYQNIYLSSINNRMNEVMKVLTIIATIFIPLTFIAGVYGMNFEYMPELGYKIAYPIIWIVMLTIAITLVVYFKKKDWF